MALQRIEDSIFEPITLSEVKKNSNVIATDDDEFILNVLIPSVRSKIEADTHRAMVVQRWRLMLDSFPADNGVIELLVPPCLSVESVKYLDEDGVTQTLIADTDYTVDLRSEPGRIVTAYGEDWPTTREIVNAVEIIFAAGYLVPCTVNDTTNTVICIGHSYSNGDRVSIFAIGDNAAVPAGLTARKSYYAINVAGLTFQLSNTQGGSAIDFSDAGTGTLFIGMMPDSLRHAMIYLASHSYAFREVVLSGRIITHVPFTYEALIRSFVFDRPGEG